MTSHILSQYQLYLKTLLNTFGSTDMAIPFTRFADILTNGGSVAIGDIKITA